MTIRFCLLTANLPTLSSLVIVFEDLSCVSYRMSIFVIGGVTEGQGTTRTEPKPSRFTAVHIVSAILHADALDVNYVRIVATCLSGLSVNLYANEH